jgi:hypothetical protein
MPKDATPSLIRQRDRRPGRHLAVAVASAVAVAVLVILVVVGGPAVDGSRPDPGRTHGDSGSLSDDSAGRLLGLDWVDDWFEDYGEGDVLDEEAAEVDVSEDRAVVHRAGERSGRAYS